MKKSERIGWVFFWLGLGLIAIGIAVGLAVVKEVGGILFGTGILLALTARILIPTTGIWCANCQEKWPPGEKCPRCNNYLH